MQNNQSAEEILNSFKALRSSTLNEEQFYDLYLQACHNLCKSYFSAIVFDLKEDYFEDKYHYSNPSEEFILKAKELCQKAKKGGFAYERYSFLDTKYKTPYVVVFINFNTNSYVALLLDKTVQSQFNEILVRTQLICDVPETYFKFQKSKKYDNDIIRTKDTQLLSENHYKNVLEVFNIIIHKDNYELALLTLVNELSFRFNCSQVSIGWLEVNTIVTKAISSIETFEKNSDTIDLLESLFEEVASQEEMLIYPNSDESLALYESERYFKHRNINQVVSIPIFFKTKLCGVVVLEMIDSEISGQDIDIVNLCVNQLSPWIMSLQQEQEPFYKRISRKFVSFTEETLSIRYTGIKFIIALLLFVLLSSLVIKIDYKVDGTASLETDFVTYLSAPYDGVIDNVKVKEGDDVLKDDLLLTLDMNELKLKENESRANVIRYNQEAEKARATGSLADMKIALSKKDEAEVSLSRVEYYISQSNIKAPYDGIVVEGDHTKLLGSPVNKGDVMLKIAKLGSMFLKIKIKEEDIDSITSSGKFIFLSRPSISYNITIDKIIPVAEVDKSEGNVFVVKAFINEKEEFWWRPGMSGIAKIDVGEKTIFWIATHKIVDFFRIYVWW